MYFCFGQLMHFCSGVDKHGLSISIPDVAGTIEWINKYHDKDALFRPLTDDLPSELDTKLAAPKRALLYDFENMRELPMCETLFPVVEAILVATK